MTAAPEHQVQRCLLMTGISTGDDCTDTASPIGSVHHSLHGNIDETSTTPKFSTAAGF
ncbi:hypothetical protein [Mycolicibacterium bacteremicum]|uniref:hypothetical protein n=1 Tax=Mycolicibacterium bacteremicum TaxID=564198 RepID=UPI0026F0C1EF|nr:hypothetical protein [Mycolicibacterium bacteremicum]